MTLFLVSFFLQSVGASRWRVCYQRGLPRLVFLRKALADLPVLTGTHEDVPSPGEGATENLVPEGGNLERFGDSFVDGGVGGDRGFVDGGVGGDCCFVGCCDGGQNTWISGDTDTMIYTPRMW